MSNQAPFCNVDLANPKADPQKATGMRLIPPGSNLQQITNIINNNFTNLVKGNFRENRARRRVVITRIYDPDDHNVYVDVRQITGLEFVNGFTGQTIDWQR